MINPLQQALPGCFDVVFNHARSPLKVDPRSGGDQQPQQDEKGRAASIQVAVPAREYQYANHLRGEDIYDKWMRIKRRNAQQQSQCGIPAIGTADKAQQRPLETNRAQRQRRIRARLVAIICENAVTAEHKQRDPARPPLKEIRRQPKIKCQCHDRDQAGKIPNDNFDMSEKMYPNILKDVFRRKTMEDLQDVIKEPYTLDVFQRIMHNPGFVLAIRTIAKMMRLHNDDK